MTGRRRRIGVVTLAAALLMLAVPRASAIVGGESAVTPARPWIAAIIYNRNIAPSNPQYNQIKNRLLCSGSLVAPDWIITAGHCVGGASPHDDVGTPSASDIDTLKRGSTVVIGRERLSTTSDGVVRKIVQIKMHPSFGLKRITFGGMSRYYLAGDVALLKLGAPVPGSYTPLPLAESADQTTWANGKNVSVFGYGMTNQNDNFSTADGLRRASVKILDKGWAPDAFSHQWSNGEACYGDSGGPVVIGSFPNYKLIGTTSGGYGGCTKTALNVAMRVGWGSSRPIYSWIRTIIPAPAVSTTTSSVLGTVPPSSSTSTTPTTAEIPIPSTTTSTTMIPHNSTTTSTTTADN